jgi:hypothetical protein
MVQLVVLALIMLTAAPAAAQDPARDSQWIPEPGTSARDHLATGARIVSTDALTWPDGRSALIVYLAKDSEVFRCIDWYNRDFTPTGFSCNRLEP